MPALPTFTGVFTRRRGPRAGLAAYRASGSGIEGGVQTWEVGQRGQHEIRAGRGEVTIGERPRRDTDRPRPRLDRGGHVRGRVADVHGPQKAAVLAGLGAAVYVGDTPADMAAAVQAGARAVGVTTGSFTERDLAAAGADLVLASLADFPALYATLDT